MPTGEHRRRIISAKAQQQEELEEELPSLRPQSLDEYDVGQEHLVAQLRIALAAARQRGDVLEHVLFDGPPGLGKTTLAHIIANEMGSNLFRASGPSLERASDLVGILTNLDRGDVLFIDEMHRLPRVVEEYMYPAMEDFIIDFVVDKGPYAKTISLHLKPFTLVGATTRAGMLTPALRERFGIFQHLDFYTEQQLQEIVARAARILGVELDGGGAQELAQRARGTPRIVIRLLRRVRDYAQIVGDGVVTGELAREALTAMGVDEEGLDNLDRKYLRTIIDYYAGGPVGINAVAATLAEETDTLEDMVEPYLLKIGFVIRTSRGREATVRAYEHLGISAPPERPGGQDSLPLNDSPTAAQEQPNDSSTAENNT